MGSGIRDHHLVVVRTCPGTTSVWRTRPFEEDILSQMALSNMRPPSIGGTRKNERRRVEYMLRFIRRY